MSVEGDASICDGLVHAVGWGMKILYAYNGIIRSREPEWLQGPLNVLIGISRQIGLMSNVAKSKVMMYHPGTIWLGI